MPLADYYAAKGEAPGRWIGSGLVGIDGLGYGDVVTAEQMKNLFGDGCDPVTGAALGRKFRVGVGGRLRPDVLARRSRSRRCGPSRRPRSPQRIRQAHNAAVLDALDVPGVACDLHPRGRRRRPPGRDPRPDRGGVPPPRLPRRRSRSAHPRRGREQGPDPRRASGSRSTARSCTSTSSPPRRPTTPPSKPTSDEAPRRPVRRRTAGGRQAPGAGDRRCRPRAVRAVVATPRATSRTASGELAERVHRPARTAPRRRRSRSRSRNARTSRPAQPKHEPRSEAEQRATWRDRGGAGAGNHGHRIA